MTEVVPGWYPDPHDATRTRFWNGTEWTEQVSSPDLAAAPTKKSRLGLWLGIGIPAVLLVGFLAIAGVVNAVKGASPSLHDGETSTHAEQAAGANAEIVPGDFAAPPTWTTHTSTAGAIAYSIDPAWEDFSALLGDPDALFGQDPQINYEFGGAWILTGDLVNGATNLVVLAASDGTTASAPEWLRGYVIGARGEFDAVNVVSIGTFTTANGYSAARQELTGTKFGTPFAMTVFAVASESTVVFVQFTTPDDFTSINDAASAVVNTLVIDHAPTG